MAAPGARAERTRGERSERTELELLRTATLLFSERGFHGTGIRDIAETAGVVVSAIYYYASSKDELLEAVIRRGLDKLIDSGRLGLDRVAGPSEQLAMLIAVHVAFHARNPRTAVVIDHEFTALPPKTKKEILAQRDAYEGLWKTVLKAGVDGGEFVDRGALARLALLEMCTGVAHWYRPRGALSIPDLCRRFGDMGLALVGARRDGEGVTVDSLRIPDAEELPRLVDIALEPNRSRARI